MASCNYWHDLDKILATRTNTPWQPTDGHPWTTMATDGPKFDSFENFPSMATDGPPVAISGKKVKIKNFSFILKAQIQLKLKTL